MKIRFRHCKEGALPDKAISSSRGDYFVFPFFDCATLRSERRLLAMARGGES